jgi:hypothetical protein
MLYKKSTTLVANDININIMVAKNLHYLYINNKEKVNQLIVSSLRWSWKY